MKTVLLAAVILVLAVVLAVARSPVEDVQIRQRIIQAGVTAYLATGHPCACPYNLMRNGKVCGLRSAHSRPGVAAPLCYLDDVTDRMVNDWRARPP